MRAGAKSSDWRTWDVESKLRMLARLKAIRGTGQTAAFADWLREVSPYYQWDVPHLVRIREELDRLTRGEIRRLAIFVPPRHGKSAMTTVRWAAWRLERDPSLRIIIGAYSYGLSEMFSRQIRRIIRERNVTLNAERQRAVEWETEQGGGIIGVGVGTGVTGRGASLIIVDDPVKNREEANSPTYRERVYNWWKEDLYTRLEPNGAVVLIQTRWHQDDLAGRILAGQGGENWTVINLPAEAEEDDPLGRQVGEALWPNRFDLAALADIRQTMGSWAYSALYQQRPLPQGGAIFQREWFRMADAAPAVARRVRYWDKGGNAQTGSGDYTVGVRMARTEEGQYFIEDVVRGNFTALGRNRVIRSTAELDGPGVNVFVEQEGGSSGSETAAISIRELAGFNVHADFPRGSKELRAQPLAAQFEAGNVFLVKAGWNADYLDELLVFPAGRNDDQVDASSGAFHKLARFSRGIYI